MAESIDAHRNRQPDAPKTPKPVGLMIARGEQSPNLESRVMLSTSRDFFGKPRADLRWLLKKEDFESMQKTLMAFAHEMGRCSKARVQVLMEWENFREKIEPSFHHCGTTRMSAEEAQGVVNRETRVYGLDNLYVAGSSVFPTIGHTNPTLTIIALTLRLSDHLLGALQEHGN
jgi:choline dehydrogenase-like flavoprotein